MSKENNENSKSSPGTGEMVFSIFYCFGPLVAVLAPLLVWTFSDRSEEFINGYLYAVLLILCVWLTVKNAVDDSPE